MRLRRIESARVTVESGLKVCDEGNQSSLLAWNESEESAACVCDQGSRSEAFTEGLCVQ